jgi:hypothetical protein
MKSKHSQIYVSLTLSVVCTVGSIYTRITSVKGKGAAKRAQAEVVCDDDDTAGEPELASPLRRPASEHPLDCLGGPCCRGCGRCTPDGSVATGAYTVPAVVVVPGASPPAGCAAAAAYSGGGTQMPPTTMNCGMGGAGAALVPALWTVAVAFGRLVCRRYF